MLKNVLKSTIRKKTLEKNVLNTQLKRCLSLFDLTMIGIGSMVGAGIFVVTGTLTRDVAGPGIFLSYIFAGFAAFLSALCYAEFGSRFPKAGSSYSYTYLVMGELPAFLVGWNMLLEMIIGGASVAKASSGSLDSLLNGAIRNASMEYIGTFNSSWMSEYPDIVALATILFWSIFIAVGVKISVVLNNILTVINVLVLLIVMACGVYFSDTSNWTNQDRGGFLPFGFSGVVAASASCFYSYSGFEAITTAAEESKNPAKHIPIALVIALVFVILLYMGASCALTLMVPYLQIDILAPFPSALSRHHFIWGQRLVAVGALMGLSASILSSIFVLPRTVYAIASDGLLFRPLSKVNSKTQTPLTAIIIFSLITGVLATFVDLKILVELLSIGTLMCFIFISISLVILRYQPSDIGIRASESNDLISQNHQNDTHPLIKDEFKSSTKSAVKKRFASIPGLKNIPRQSVAPIAVTLMVIFSLCFILTMLHAFEHVLKMTWWVLVLLSIFSLCFFASFLFLCAFEQNSYSSSFKVPLVPLLPVVSMVVNTYLILNLNYWTWIRLLVWLILGLLIYFGYGIRHSEEKHKTLLTVPYKLLSTSEYESDETSHFSVADDSI